MTATARNFVLFKTDLFLFYPPDEDIDRWRVGGDCAGWFYARLLPIHPIQGFDEPVMEDWGWTFTMSIDDVRVRVNVWAFFYEENCWLFSLYPEKRLFRRQKPEAMLRARDVLCDALEDILSRDPRILKHAWFAENPFDLNVKGF